MSRTGIAIQALAEFIESHGAAPGSLAATRALEVVTDRLLAAQAKMAALKAGREAFPPMLGGWFHAYPVSSQCI